MYVFSLSPLTEINHNSTPPALHLSAFKIMLRAILIGSDYGRAACPAPRPII